MFPSAENGGGSSDSSEIASGNMAPGIVSYASMRRGRNMDKGKQIFGVILLAAFLYAFSTFSRLSGTFSGDKHPGNQRPLNQPPLVTTR